MKTLLFLLLLVPSLASADIQVDGTCLTEWNGVRVTQWNGVNVSCDDTTPPTIVSATINSNGDTLTLVFSEPVINAYALSGSGSGTLTDDPTGASLDAIISGEGSNSVAISINKGPVLSGDTCTYSYSSSGNVTDNALNPLADINNIPVTNNSAQ